MTVTIQLRRGTTDEWETTNPVLHNGEPGFDWQTDILKIGDGSTSWNDLPAIQGGSGIPGKSAYEVAVEEGFVGTVQEWLDSLVGEQGPVGEVSNADLTGAITTHVNDPLPHPAYDNIQTLTLVFENGLM